MAILKLTDKGTKDALEHPLIRTKTRIGRGAFCIVFDNDSSVYKLTCDKFQYAFYSHESRPSNDFFPKLINDYGIVGGVKNHSLFLVEMEKLQPMERKALTPPNAWMQRKNLLRAANEHRRKTWMQFDCSDSEAKLLTGCLRGVSEYDYIDDELGNAASLLANFCETFSCSPDLHRSNFMLRGSQLVFNDTVKDQHTIYRRSLLRLMPLEAVDVYLRNRLA
jgi:hypothetical protein